MSDFINTVDIIGEEELVNALLQGTLSGAFCDNTLKMIGRYGLSNQQIQSVNCPLVETLGAGAFYDCDNLTDINLPLAKDLSKGEIFNSCERLLKVVLPSAAYIGTRTFNQNHKLKTIDLPKLEQLMFQAISNCSTLIAIIIRSSNVATAQRSDFIGNTCYHFQGIVNETYNPNGDKDGYFYVPKDLIEDYKVATNWTIYADQFRALEDYTVDGTITGELDESKI